MSGRQTALKAKDPTATMAELEEAEQELRETAERQITNMEEEAPDHFITLEELDECPDYDPLRAIDDAVAEIVQLGKNIESDAIDWGEGFKALVRARANAEEEAHGNDGCQAEAATSWQADRLLRCRNARINFEDELRRCQNLAGAVLPQPRMASASPSQPRPS